MFFRRMRQRLTDGVIDLVPVYYQQDPAMGFGEVYDFRIVPHKGRQVMGEISLRTGESPCIYYFGHIGYHVDPPYRGHYLAARACRLASVVYETLGIRDVVITCDPDNIPSRKTCERLGAVLERTVSVPDTIRNRWEISAVKCRYIWRITDSMTLED